MSTSSSTDQNPFLTITETHIAEARTSLENAISHQVYVLCIKGNGEDQYVRSCFRDIRRALASAIEFGVPGIFPLEIEEPRLTQIIQAIGVYKRAGVKSEILKILTNLLTSCGIPASLIEKA